MADRILFLCPHGAAKSVMAAAYLQRLAQQRGLGVQADAAGTDPDAQTNPDVVELLYSEGIDVSSHQPRRVTSTDIDRARLVISLGCDVSDLPVMPADKLKRWDEVPPPSQNLAGAWATIRRYVEQLVNDLTGQSPGQMSGSNP